MKFLKHFGGGESGCGVAPAGSEFLKRHKEKIALMESRMGKGERWGVDLKKVDCNKIDVDKAVGIIAVGPAMRIGGNGFLYLEKAVEDLLRGKVGFKHHPEIQEFVWGFEPPGFGFHYMADFISSECLSYQSHGAAEIEPSLTKVATDVDEYSRHMR